MNLTHSIVIIDPIITIIIDVIVKNNVSIELLVPLLFVFNEFVIIIWYNPVSIMTIPIISHPFDTIERFLFFIFYAFLDVCDAICNR